MQSNQSILHEKTRIIVWMTALHSRQLASTLVRCTTPTIFTKSCVAARHQGAKPSIDANRQTALHHIIVVQRQLLALLELTLQLVELADDCTSSSSSEMLMFSLVGMEHLGLCVVGHCLIMQLSSPANSRPEGARSHYVQHSVQAFLYFDRENFDLQPCTSH